jgi:C1A family cysteine protease
MFNINKLFNICYNNLVIFLVQKIFVGSSDQSDTTGHGMLLVGYGHSSLNREYWILKNSWGVKWGLGGYIYLLRDKSTKEGTYHINKRAYFPVIST